MMVIAQDPINNPLIEAAFRDINPVNYSSIYPRSRNSNNNYSNQRRRNCYITRLVLCCYMQLSGWMSQVFLF